VKRSPATVFAIANRHGIAEYCTAFPITKNASDSMPALRPMYANSRIWKIGATSNDGM
jgi:hypothetical protein